MGIWIKIRYSKIRFSDLENKQNEFLNKLNKKKIGKKTKEQKEVIKNLEKFYISREEVINFIKDYTRLVFDSKYNAKNKTKGEGLKNINTQTNASKVTNSFCTSKSQK